VLGRRQLQRWLQLLLYARQQPDGLPNLLLPLAARRGAQLEALARLQGDDRDAQDLAFMTGVFSLLDRLLHMPMSEIAAELYLPVLQAAGVSLEHWWSSQLHAYHWAIEVGRNV
jgi:c-di-GMP-related signal transduction protein